LVELFTTQTGKTEGCGLLNGIAQIHYGASAPAVTWPFQEWGDTGNNLLKQRNEADDDWIVRGTLNAENYGFVVQSYVDNLILAKRQEDDPIGTLKPILSTTATTNHLLLDGKTIGDNSSGASSRANDDVVLLYTFLWENLADAQAPVSGGRGANAAADFAAHKTITLPDTRGRVLVGLDNLGGSSANTIQASWADTIGATGGTETHTLTVNEIPSHNHSNGVQLSGSGVGGNGGSWVSSLANTGSTGGGLAHNNTQPGIAVGYQMRYKY
jgi:hypothetical protein